MGSRRQQAARVRFFWDSTPRRGNWNVGRTRRICGMGLEWPRWTLHARPVVGGLCWCWVGMGVTRSRRRPGGGYMWTLRSTFAAHSSTEADPTPYAYIHTRHDDRQSGVRPRRGPACGRGGRKQHWSSSSSEATRPWYVAWFFMHTCICTCVRVLIVPASRPRSMGRAAPTAHLPPPPPPHPSI